MANPKLIVHGGAGTIQPYAWERFRTQAHAAALAGSRVLAEGGTALAAAIAAVRFMEDDVTFNAGIGSAINADGEVECDAFVMTDDLEMGAIAGVKGVRYPVELARVVMEETHHYLVVADGACRLADQHGIERCDPASMVTERRRARWLEMKAANTTFSDDPEREKRDDPLPVPEADEADTVGACALDSAGRLAVASSTGGMVMKVPGRASDIAAVGSGCYCGSAGAVACTGHGEPVMRVCMAKYAYDLLASGSSAEDAAQQAVKHMVDLVAGRAGLILLDADGNRAWATSTTHIGVGVPECIPDDVGGYIPGDV